MTMKLAVDVRARLAVIDPVAVADVEATLGAVPPDRVLDEPGKDAGKCGLNAGHRSARPFGNDVGAAAGPVAGHAIGVVGAEPVQDAGSVQEIVDQGVDGDHGWPRPRPRSHGHAVPPAGCRTGSWSGPCQRPRRPPGAARSRLPHPGRAGRGWLGRRHLELPVDPADQVAIGNVANEQEQGIGHLVEPTVPQVVGRQRAGGNVVGLGAGSAALVVPAAVEMPVALELWASGLAATLASISAHWRPAVPLHVFLGDLVRDALVAQRRHQPIEQRRGVGRRMAPGMPSARRSARISSIRLAAPARQQTPWISRTA